VSGGRVYANLDRVRIWKTDVTAVIAGDNSVVDIFRSNISGGWSEAHGIAAYGTSTVNVLRSEVSLFYGAAISAAGATSVVRLSKTNLVNNANGIFIAPGAVVESAGDNFVANLDLVPPTPPNGLVNLQ
jgi:hypothetical protein